MEGKHEWNEEGGEEEWEAEEKEEEEELYFADLIGIKQTLLLLFV